MSTPQISVLIIAHNEENHIEECINAILKQSVIPDEIILVLHNCTDATCEISMKYSGYIRIIEHNTPETGPHIARIRGFREAQGEIIACIDGDAIAEKYWLENITTPFREDSTVV
jgi:glycosyltransferase involved in cell wall biosynthesis